MSDKQKAFLFIFLYSSIGGAMAAVTKIGLTQIPPLSFAFIRFFFAALIVMPFVWSKRRFLVNDLKALGPFSILATLNIIFFILGIKLTTANISQVLYAAVPIIVGLITHFVIGEKLTSRKIIGIVVGFIGAFLILFLPILEKGKFSGNLWGNILLVMAVLSWSLYMVLSKKAQKTHSPFHIVTIFIIVTAVTLLPFSIFESTFHYGWWDKIGPNAIFSMLYVILLGTISSYLLNQYIIKHRGAVFASMSFYLTPVFGFISAFLLLGEQLTLGLIGGGLLVLLGVYITTKK